MLGLNVVTDKGTDVSDRTLVAILALHADWQRLQLVAKTARTVRDAQKRYFRDRTGLPECKALESRLDGMLK